MEVLEAIGKLLALVAEWSETKLALVVALIALVIVLQRQVVRRRSMRPPSSASEQPPAFYEVPTRRMHIPRCDRCGRRLNLEEEGWISSPNRLLCPGCKGMAMHAR